MFLCYLKIDERDQRTSCPGELAILAGFDNEGEVGVELLRRDDRGIVEPERTRPGGSVRAVTGRLVVDIHWYKVVRLIHVEEGVMLLDDDGVSVS